MPSGTEVHIGVYDFHERQHAQLLQRRNDLVALLMYLTERRIFFSINHVFSSVTGRRESEDFAWFQEYFPAIETRNSHMLEATNGYAASLAAQWDKIAIGGSDAHALASVGTAYTEVPGARDKEEFFAGLQSGKGVVAGESGCFAKLTRDVFLIGVRNDAREVLDRSDRAAGSARPGHYLSELSRRAFVQPSLGGGGSAPARIHASVPAGSPCRSARWRSGYDRSQSSLEPDSIERSPPDAPRAPLARPAVVPHSHDCGHTGRRRMALVRTRPDSGALRWRASLRRHRGGRFQRRGGDLFVPRPQAHQPAQKTLRN